MVDVAKREDRLLDELGSLYHARSLALIELELLRTSYPRMADVWDSLAKCLS